VALSEKQATFPAQATLILTVALDELETSKAEPKLGKVRAHILSVESTLRELLELAKEASGQGNGG
jgi:hypothetical protein